LVKFAENCDHKIDLRNKPCTYICQNVTRRTSYLMYL
jgi:hypothetical protein